MAKQNYLQTPLPTVSLTMRPLIWMFANKPSIDEILKIHKRTLQIVYDVYDESYENRFKQKWRYFDTSETPVILCYWSL